MKIATVCLYRYILIILCSSGRAKGPISMNFRLISGLFSICIIFTMSLQGMFAPMVLFLGMGQRPAFKESRVSFAVKVRDQSQRFALLVAKSADKITDPRLVPLKCLLSGYAKGPQRSQNIAQVWQEGLRTSYDQALKAIKTDLELTDHHWNKLLKFKEFCKQKNPLSSENPKSEKKPVFQAGGCLSQKDLDICISCIIEKVPNGSTIKIIPIGFNGAAQSLYDKNGIKFHTPSKLGLRLVHEIVNKIYIDISRVNGADTASLQYILSHELQHLINNDHLIIKFLLCLLRKGEECGLVKNLSYVMEYCADLEPALNNSRITRFAIQTLEGDVKGCPSDASFESNTHPSLINRLRMAKLLLQHQEQEAKFKVS